MDQSINSPRALSFFPVRLPSSIKLLLLCLALPCVVTNRTYSNNFSSQSRRTFHFFPGHLISILFALFFGTTTIIRKTENFPTTITRKKNVNKNKEKARKMGPNSVARSPVTRGNKIYKRRRKGPACNVVYRKEEEGEMARDLPFYRASDIEFFF